jgi:hypothetical protein
MIPDQHHGLLDRLLILIAEFGRSDLGWIDREGRPPALFEFSRVYEIPLQPTRESLDAIGNDLSPLHAVTLSTPTGHLKPEFPGQPVVRINPEFPF